MLVERCKMTRMARRSKKGEKEREREMGVYIGEHLKLVKLTSVG